MNDSSAKPVLTALTVQASLQALVSQILGKPGGGEPIPVDARLSELGMSSIKMVNLMLAVEGEFDLSIPQGDITPENFRSIASIEALLARLLGIKP